MLQPKGCTSQYGKKYMTANASVSLGHDRKLAAVKVILIWEAKMKSYLWVRDKGTIITGVTVLQVGMA